MSHRYEDVIRQMERSGHYSSASEYRDSLREHNISERDTVDRSNPADGARYSHAGNMAERAYEDLRHEDRRTEERHEEQQREEQEAYRRHQQQQERMQEEEFYEQQRQEQFQQELEQQQPAQ